MKDNHAKGREIPKYEDAVYAKSTTSYLKADTSTGQHYVDLNEAMNNYRGAWLYGHEHVVTNVGKLRAEWEQFCPVPADIGDGVLVKGNVLYRHADGSWAKSGDQFEGVLRTVHGAQGGRYFIGRTQHTFLGRRFPGGSLKVVAQLNLHLSQRSSSNPLFKVPRSNPEAVSHYRRSSYSSPTLSYPSYETEGDGF